MPSNQPFPVPPVDDGRHHVYLSVGHQQMMTDPMTPLGLSVWKMTAIPPMVDAGGRLFVDVTDRLATTVGRTATLEMFAKADPLLRDALQQVLERDDFLPAPVAAPAGPPPAAATPAAPAPPPLPTDAGIVTTLVQQWHDATQAVRSELASRTGASVFEVIADDVAALRLSLMDPTSMQAINAGMDATWWLNEQLEGWLGERNAADALAQSAPGNVTSEMGLALLDVADAVRPHPGVIVFFDDVDRSGFDDARFLAHLATLDGGDEVVASMTSFLDRYGMRCVGEIDIARPRWIERPTALVPLLLSNIRNFEAGEATRRFELGLERAAQKESAILGRLQQLPDGAAKADEARRAIERLRTFIGYREHPKYAIVSRYLVHKQAMLAEVRDLVAEGVLRSTDDMAFLTFRELHEAVRTRSADPTLIERRRHEFASYHSLTPPRVLTSDGQALTGSYREQEREGVLPGMAVSGGVVEGRARVILDVADADLEPGDILVTAYTDPSWCPVFVGVRALVTEVGGVMTHGAVIAREYGLPAVVGVQRATTLIQDGQRIRVNGTDGWVELLS